MSSPTEAEAGYQLDQLRPARWYLVYSNEHEKWWGPRKRGYTPFIEAAGRYRLIEAKAIVAQCARAGERPRQDPVTGKTVVTSNEVLVLAPECLGDAD